MATTYWRRDIASTVSGVQNAPETFTSWQKCQQKSYCKWPAIIGCIIGAIIVLSLLWCMIQCCCCGISCCNACCACCKRRKKPGHKHLDEPPPTPAAPEGGYRAPPAPPSYQSQTPQFATFDASTKKDPDALPAMPSMDSAVTKKIVDDSPAPEHKEDLEMAPLKPTQPSQRRPMLSDASPTTSYRGGPASPYRERPRRRPTDPAMNGSALDEDGFSPVGGGGYGGRSPYGRSPGPGPRGDESPFLDNTYSRGQARSPRPPQGMPYSDTRGYGGDAARPYDNSPSVAHPNQPLEYDYQSSPQVSPPLGSYHEHDTGFGQVSPPLGSYNNHNHNAAAAAAGGPAYPNFSSRSPSSPPPMPFQSQSHPIDSPYERPAPTPSPQAIGSYRAFSPANNNDAPAYQSPVYQELPASEPGGAGQGGRGRPPSALTPGRGRF
ncbi:MAG: hypothetical protein M1824_005966 [Vezdaea acicularis]|nr:MAG: hypothetical protein M1824_005966 [Vezdaea acicularis]